MSERPKDYDANHPRTIDTAQLADELAAQVQAMNKGQYLLLCAAIEASGGTVDLDPVHLANEALRMPPRIEIESTDDRITLRLPT